MRKKQKRRTLALKNREMQKTKRKRNSNIRKLLCLGLVASLFFLSACKDTSKDKKLPGYSTLPEERFIKQTEREVDFVPKATSPHFGEAIGPGDTRAKKFVETVIGILNNGDLGKLYDEQKLFINASGQVEVPERVRNIETSEKARADFDLQAVSAKYAIFEFINVEPFNIENQDTTKEPIRGFRVNMNLTYISPEKYGAAMGRLGIKIDPDDPADFSLKATRFIDKNYDKLYSDKKAVYSVVVVEDQNLGFTIYDEKNFYNGLSGMKQDYQGY